MSDKVESPEARIHRMVDVMFDALQNAAKGATSDEVFSACMHIAVSSLTAVQNMGGNMEAFRPVITDMWKMLPIQRMDG
jgi:hypothetical protein